MNLIKVKKDIKNTLDNQFKNINAKLELDKPLEENEYVYWSFVSDDNNLLHSGDAEEGTYLNYESQLSPIIEIKLPSIGTYSLKIVAEKTTVTQESTIEQYLDANGDIAETTNLTDVFTVEYFESSVIELVYNDNNDDEWV